MGRALGLVHLDPCVSSPCPHCAGSADSDERARPHHRYGSCVGPLAGHRAGQEAPYPVTSEQDEITLLDQRSAELTLLIDGDVIAFTAASAVQRIHEDEFG